MYEKIQLNEGRLYRQVCEALDKGRRQRVLKGGRSSESVIKIVRREKIRVLK
jgi:predicted Ser/Thr protein kinase